MICSLPERYRRFGGTYCFIFKVEEHSALVLYITGHVQVMRYREHGDSRFVRNVSTRPPDYNTCNNPDDHSGHMPEHVPNPRLHALFLCL
jgi:hypothetical protein